MKATNYNTAINLVANVALDSLQQPSGLSKKIQLLEVDADGSIRTQNAKEKLVNFAARLTGRFDVRQRQKDAVVAAALQHLYDRDVVQSAIPEQRQINAPQTYGFLSRFHQTLAHSEQQGVARSVSIESSAASRVAQLSLADISTRGPNGQSLANAGSRRYLQTDAQVERQLPYARPCVLSPIANAIFGDPEDRVARVRIRLPSGPSWTHEYSISNAVQNAQLKGIALSANPQSPALDTSKPVVLFFGGSGARVEEAAYGAAKICGSDAGLNFVSVNYRGFGDSTSIAPTPRTLIEDAKTAYSHLRDLGFPPEKIILRGYSLGATAAGHLHAMSELKGEKLGGVIYDRPMPSAQKAAAGATGYTAAGWLTKMLAGSFGASPNLRVMDHFIGRSERKAPVLVIADNGTHPNNDFLGAAATEMAQQYGLDLVQSRGDHFMHDEANQAAQSFLGRLN